MSSQFNELFVTPKDVTKITGVSINTARLYLRNIRAEIAEAKQKQPKFISLTRFAEFIGIEADEIKRRLKEK